MGQAKQRQYDHCDIDLINIGIFPRLSRVSWVQGAPRSDLEAAMAAVQNPRQSQDPLPHDVLAPHTQAIPWVASTPVVDRCVEEMLKNRSFLQESKPGSCARERNHPAEYTSPGGIHWRDGMPLPGSFFSWNRQQERAAV